MLNFFWVKAVNLIRGDKTLDLLKKVECKGVRVFILKPVFAQCVFFVFLLASSSSFAVKPGFSAIEPFEAEFSLISRKNFSNFGQVTYRLQAVGDGYYLSERSSRSMFRSRREVSEFTIDGCKVTPSGYWLDQSGFGPDLRYSLKFSTKDNSVTYKANKREHPVIVSKQQQYYDPLTEIIALQCSLLSSKPRVDLDNPVLQASVLHKAVLEKHDFYVVAHETLSISNRNLNTVRVERQIDSNTPPDIFWFSVQDRYALVKMFTMQGNKPLIFEIDSIKWKF